ncbi:MAG TPA: hypothetical protein VLK29_10555 [Luteimonas sp.]|nr:hypothetical protein [Luteimonas sp.]
MPCPILRLRQCVLGCLLPLLALTGTVEARSAVVRIARVTTAVATLHDVRVRLDWPDGARQGDLQLSAGRIDADGLGYHLRRLAWRCPLSRDADGLRCAGDLRLGDRRARLALDLRSASTDAVLSSGPARFAVRRTAAAPDDTLIDLARVPVAWAQALSTQAWAGGRLTGGTLDGQLRIEAPRRGPLRVHGALGMQAVAVDTADATVAAENLSGHVRVDYRAFPTRTLLTLDAALRGGELLSGNAYIALPATPVRVRLDGRLDAGQGWVLPRWSWDDGATLQLDGSAVLDADANVRDLALTLRSADASALPVRYLSGWLGPAGLGGLRLEGALDGALRLQDGELAAFALQPHALSLGDDAGGFSLGALDGDLRHAAQGRVDSTLHWRAATLGAVPVGPATLPFRSEDGLLAMRADVDIGLLGGTLRLDGFQLRPPADGAGLRMQAGLTLEAIDLAALSSALGAPAFRGTLAGRIPMARYADEALAFDGGLAMDLFDGRVQVTALAMERPFGVAPTLSADLDLRGLDLLAITEVFDFGSITGRLDGHVAGLRLVDWSPTAFDASFRTVPRRGVRQRISQRAVQNISSVGDASFVGTLQGQLIGLFDDFGYRRIGIGCRLENTVCQMSGLGTAGDGFTLIEGSGLPRLQVVGFNPRVDWATLVERLAAVGSGEVSPVIE